MKKIKYIMMIAGFATLGFTAQQLKHNCAATGCDTNELDGYANDMIEYINFDLADGNIDSLVAETYIDIMKEIKLLNAGNYTMK